MQGGSDTPYEHDEQDDQIEKKKLVITKTCV